MLAKQCWKSRKTKQNANELMPHIECAQLSDGEQIDVAILLCIGAAELIERKVFQLLLAIFSKWNENRTTLSTWWIRCIWLRWNSPESCEFWMRIMCTIKSAPCYKPKTWSARMSTLCTLKQLSTDAGKFPWRLDFHKWASQPFRSIAPLQCLQEVNWTRYWKFRHEQQQTAGVWRFQQHGPTNTA